MKIVRTFLAIATAALASTAVTAETAPKTFERDGVVYEYVSTPKDGKTILEGTANGRSPFRLVVTETKVRGKFNGQYVSFARPKSVSAESAVLAAR